MYGWGDVELEWLLGPEIFLDLLQHFQVQSRVFGGVIRCKLLRVCVHITFMGILTGGVLVWGTGGGGKGACSDFWDVDGEFARGEILEQLSDVAFAR